VPSNAVFRVSFSCSRAKNYFREKVKIIWKSEEKRAGFLQLKKSGKQFAKFADATCKQKSAVCFSTRFKTSSEIVNHAC
jgi:hypothetical protein